MAQCSITSKKLRAYKIAHKEWISENDDYNKTHFGITKAEYDSIHEAVQNLKGIAGPFPSLAAIQREVCLDPLAKISRAHGGYATKDYKHT